MPDAWSWGLGLSGTVPISDRNQGGILRAEAERERAQAGLEQALIDARAEVEQALEDYRVAYAVLTQNDRDLLKAAADARDKVREAYRQGSRGLIEVLDAQNAYRQAVRLSIDARVAYWRSLHALNAAVGRELVH
jgi:cobalt-zinc-cadmium efflux system outer membrane protein